MGYILEISLDSYSMADCKAKCSVSTWFTWYWRLWMKFKKTNFFLYLEIRAQLHSACCGTSKHLGKVHLLFCGFRKNSGRWAWKFKKILLHFATTLMSTPLFRIFYVHGQNGFHHFHNFCSLFNICVDYIHGCDGSYRCFNSYSLFIIGSFMYIVYGHKRFYRCPNFCSLAIIGSFMYIIQGNNGFHYC